MKSLKTTKKSILLTIKPGRPFERFGSSWARGLPESLYGWDYAQFCDPPFLVVFSEYVACLKGDADENR